MDAMSNVAHVISGAICACDSGSAVSTREVIRAVRSRLPAAALTDDTLTNMIVDAAASCGVAVLFDHRPGLARRGIGDSRRANVAL